MSRRISATLGAFVWLLVALASAPAAPSAQQLVGGAVSGRVVDDTGAPLAGAEVSLSETLQIFRVGDRVISRKTGAVTVRADSDGSFHFLEVEPGVYQLSAALEGHSELPYGGARPNLYLGTPVLVEDGRATANLEVRLPRSGGISGTVRDHTGQPKAMNVEAFPSSQAWPQLAPGISTTAGRDGRFVIEQLPPGEYFVRVTPLAALPTLDPAEGREAAMQPAPTFYPGAFDPARAALVTVRPGEDAGGIDIAVREQSRSEITLDLANVRVAGQAPDELQAWFTRFETLGQYGGMGIIWSRRASGARANGPLPRRLVAGVFRALVDATVEDERWSWSGVVTADGVSPLKLEPVLGPPAMVTGRVIRDDDLDVETPTIRLVPAEPFAAREFDRRAEATVSDSGRFEMRNLVPGRYVMVVDDGADEWLALDRLTLAGSDILDLPFDVVAGQVVHLEASLSTARAELTGRVVDGTDTPRSDVTLAVFPLDDRYWWRQSRRIRALRPDTSGTFQIATLPPGDYLIAPMNDYVYRLFSDATLLASLASGATPVRLVAGETTEQVIRVR